MSIIDPVEEKSVSTTAIESSKKSWFILLVYAAITAYLARLAWIQVRAIITRSEGYQFQTSDLLPLVLIAVCAVLVGRILLSMRNFLNSLRLDQSAELSRGKVVDKWVKRGPEDEDYWLVYEYGQGWRAKIRLSHRRYQALNVGDEIMVEYLPESPSVTRIKEDDLRL